MANYRRVCLLLAIVMLLGGLGTIAPTQAQPPAVPAQAPAGPAVVRLYVKDRTELDPVAGALDIWEVHYDKGYAVVGRSDQYRWLSSPRPKPEITPARRRCRAHAPLTRFYY